MVVELNEEKTGEWRREEEVRRKWRRERERENCEEMKVNEGEGKNLYNYFCLANAMCFAVLSFCSIFNFLPLSSFISFSLLFHIIFNY
jgi:hypothetical protein